MLYQRVSNRLLGLVVRQVEQISSYKQLKRDYEVDI